jgi:hypothetical protein
MGPYPHPGSNRRLPVLALIAAFIAQLLFGILNFVLGILHLAL